MAEKSTGGFWGLEDKHPGTYGITIFAIGSFIGVLLALIAAHYLIPMLPTMPAPTVAAAAPASAAPTAATATTTASAV